MPFAIWVVTDHAREGTVQNHVFAHDEACSVVHELRRYWFVRRDAKGALVKLEQLGYHRQSAERMLQQPGGSGVVKMLGLPYDCLVYGAPLTDDLLTAERFVVRQILPETFASVVGPIPSREMP